jgi:hypothetical protein
MHPAWIKGGKMPPLISIRGYDLIWPKIDFAVRQASRLTASRSWGIVIAPISENTSEELFCIVGLSKTKPRGIGVRACVVGREEANMLAGRIFCKLLSWAGFPSKSRI